MANQQQRTTHSSFADTLDLDGNMFNKDITDNSKVHYKWQPLEYRLQKDIYIARKRLPKLRHLATLRTSDVAKYVCINKCFTLHLHLTVVLLIFVIVLSIFFTNKD